MINERLSEGLGPTIFISRHTSNARIQELSVKAMGEVMTQVTVIPIGTTTASGGDKPRPYTECLIFIDIMLYSGIAYSIIVRYF